MSTLPWSLAAMVGIAATSGVVVGVREEPEIESSKRRDSVTGGAGLSPVPPAFGQAAESLGKRDFSGKAHSLGFCLQILFCL